MPLMAMLLLETTLAKGNAPLLKSLNGRNTINDLLQLYRSAGADDKIIEAFASFPHDLTADTESELERFVCDVYVPNKNISKVKEARWIKFKINSSNISSLPPTLGALHQHLLRSHWQAKLWINALESHPSNLDPKNYGWYQCED